MRETNNKRHCVTEWRHDGNGIPGSWQRAVKDAIRDVGELAEILEIDETKLRARAALESAFELIVPRGFVSRMHKGDLNDPLLLQVLPQAQELEPRPGFSRDPLRETSLGSAGVIQKYEGRALLVATGACPVHCRYCFRRHFPYSLQLAARSNWRPAVERLRETPSVNEVILSGGDPLSLSNTKLAVLLNELENLGTVDTLRIHTRFPIVIPERVDAGLTQMLEATHLQTVVVVHANHGNEIDASVSSALRELHGVAGILLNQSVLLAGINDSSSVLSGLSRRLHASRTLPYYLHLLDKVDGAAHFDVDEHSARRIVAEMSASLPGYLVPKLVRETPGDLSKVLIL